MPRHQLTVRSFNDPGLEMNAEEQTSDRYSNRNKEKPTVDEI